MNFGSHLLQKLNAILDFGQNVLQIGTTQIPLLKPKQKPSFSESPSLATISTHDAEKDDEEDMSPSPFNSSRQRGEIRGYCKRTTCVPPHSVGVVQLKLHSKEDRLSRLPATSSASLEINTDEMFAQANDLQQPMTALTSTGQLILPIANDSDEEMIIKKISV